MGLVLMCEKMATKPATKKKTLMRFYLSSFLHWLLADSLRLAAHDEPTKSGPTWLTSIARFPTSESWFLTWLDNGPLSSTHFKRKQSIILKTEIPYSLQHILQLEKLLSQNTPSLLQQSI